MYENKIAFVFQAKQDNIVQGENHIKLGRKSCEKKLLVQDG